MNYVQQFWQETERYHDLAERYERGIAIAHPPFVTSNGVGHRLIYHDVWCATKVKYYEYRGERLT